MNTTIGHKIKELRSKRGLELGKKYTGKMLSTELGISRSYLGDIENDRSIPNLFLLNRICTVFNISINDLIKNTNLDNTNFISTFTNNEILNENSNNSITPNKSNESESSSTDKKIVSDFIESLVTIGLIKDPNNIEPHIEDMILSVAKKEIQNLFENMRGDSNS